jgi:hypothetical protein
MISSWIGAASAQLEIEANEREEQEEGKMAILGHGFYDEGTRRDLQRQRNGGKYACSSVSQCGKILIVA